MGDKSGLLQQQIRIFQQEIDARLQNKNDREDMEELRDRLSELSNIELWNGMSKEGLRSAFCWFVDRVLLDFENRTIDVRLLPGLESGNFIK